MTRSLPLTRVYARPDLCPECWTRLDDTTCSRCGLVLDGPAARELLAVCALVDQWLDLRAQELTALRSGARTQVPLPSPAPVDGPVPVVYGRNDLCPQCWTRLTGLQCRGCGLPLTGPGAAAVLHAGRQLDGWLAVRAGIIGRLPRRQQTGPAQQPHRVPASAAPAGPAAATRPVGPAGAGLVPQRVDGSGPASAAAGPTPTAPPPAPVAPAPPAPPAPPATPEEPWWSRWKVTPQGLLLGLGALLVGVSAVIFLAVTWDQLDIRGRSLVLASVTVLTLVVAVSTRTRLPATAETFGALSVVLLCLDVVALRATELFAAGVPWSDYAAGAALGVALASLGLGRWTGLQAFAHGAAVLLPVALALVGHALAPQPGSVVAPGFVVGAGSLAGLIVGVLAMHRRARLGWPALVCYGTGLLLQVPTMAVAAELLVDDDLMWLGALLGAAALAAAAHAALLPRSRALASAVVGVLAAAAPALVTFDRVSTWWVFLAPLCVAGLVLAVTALRDRLGRVLDVRALTVGALVLLACWAGPGLVLTALRAAGSLGAATQPHTGAATRRWAEVMVLAPGTDLAWAGLGAGVVAGVALLVWGRTESRAARQLGVLVLAGVTVSLPWWPQLPVVAVVGVGVLASIALVLAGRLLIARPGFPHSGLHLTAAAVILSVGTVIAAWTSEVLAAPTTALGAAGLVFWWTRARRPLLWAPTTTALVLSGCALGLWLGLSGAQLGFVMVWTALVLLSLVIVAPATWLDTRNRVVLGGCALAWATLGVSWQVLALVLPVQVPGGAALATWTCLAALVCALAAAVDPRSLLPLGGRVAAVPVALASAFGLGLSAQAWAQLDRPALASAVAMALAAGALTALRLRRLGLPRQVSALEMGLGVGAGLSLVLLVVDSQAWPVLLALGVGAGLVAWVPQRRDVGWLAWALFALAWVQVLTELSVRTVEWFSVPAALALLGAGVWAARADGRVRRPSLFAGTALLLLPTAMVGVSGGPWRTVLVLMVGLGVGGGAVLLTSTGLKISQSRASPRVARGREVLALTAPAVALTLAAPWGRGVAGLPVGPQNDLWVLGAAAAWTLLGWALLGRTPWARSWTVGLGMALGTLPLLLQALTPTQVLWRTWAVTLVAGGVLCAAQWRSLRPPAPRGLGGLSVAAGALLAVGAVLGAFGQLFRSGGYAPESATVPAALVLLVVGVLRMRETTEGSWRVVGPALLLGLVPSWVIALGGGSLVRVLVLTVVCASVVVLGVRLRWQSMLVVGAAVLIGHTVVQLAPWFVLAYEAVPRWAHLAAVGGVLLVLGARYEHRMADVRSVRRRFRELR